VVRRRVRPDALLRLRGGRRPLAPYREGRLRSARPGLYPKFKQWCDDYFFLKHRGEPRGHRRSLLRRLQRAGFRRLSFTFLAQRGRRLRAGLPAHRGRRKATPYGGRERDFQLYRRGRYVEFNLVCDRGTIFGLQSGGRTESILMSLPPLVAWRYDWKPEPGTPRLGFTTSSSNPATRANPHFTDFPRTIPCRRRLPASRPPAGLDHVARPGATCPSIAR